MLFELPGTIKQTNELSKPMKFEGIAFQWMVFKMSMYPQCWLLSNWIATNFNSDLPFDSIWKSTYQCIRSMTNLD